MFRAEKRAERLALKSSSQVPLSRLSENLSRRRRLVIIKLYLGRIIKITVV